jgi:aryl sulfotransferase
MSGIVWLASYLKSGNTWMRLALASLRDGGALIDINDFNGLEDTISSSRHHFDTVLDIDSSDLTASEIRMARAEMYRHTAQMLRAPAFWKTHEACTLLSDGTPIFPSSATKNVIYMVRDPRDVAISLANHAGTSIEDAISMMGHPGLIVSQASSGLPLQLEQQIGSWSENVESWLDHAPCDPVVVRYEDMCQDMTNVLRLITNRIGISAEPSMIAATVKATDFAVLRDQEKKVGFAEKPGTSTSFFRSGITGEWRKILTESQTTRIERDHGRVMTRLGYL